MFTVKNILKDDLFKNFELVAGADGLNNSVKGTAIFDWETPEEINRTFSSGDFVITTLRKLKENKADADKCIAKLFDIKVSAIAIRNIYYDNVPNDIIRMADFFGIPIFIFGGVYTEDLIYCIKSQIAKDADRRELSNLVMSLITNPDAPDLLHDFSQKSNIDLHGDIISIFLSSIKNANLDDIYNKIDEKMMKCLDAEEACPDYVLARVGNGILLLYSYKKSIEKKGEYPECIESVLARCSKIDGCHIGISEKLSKFYGEAIFESFFACVCCIVDNKSVYGFEKLGVDSFIVSNQNKLQRQRYDAKIKGLMEYDKSHGSFLIETLRVFVECHGSVRLAGKKLYQHENTVRYRVNKIKDLLSLEEAENYFIEMYIIVRIIKISECEKYLIQNNL